LNAGDPETLPESPSEDVVGGRAGHPILCFHDNLAADHAMTPHVDPLFALSGFFVGLLVGQTGMGGGSLMTPILVLLFGVHPATAVGTDLLYASATKTASPPAACRQPS
jgi:hypothetical protein